MILYVLKFSGCLFLCYLVYSFLLGKEKMYTFNRYYLLGSLALSFIVPLLNIDLGFSLGFWSTDLDLAASNSDQNHLAIVSWVSGIYLLITAVLAIRFMLHLTKTIQLVRHHEVVVQEKVKLVLVPGLKQPFASFNYVFLSASDYLNHQIPLEILQHEMAHVQQKHTWDLILVNIVTVIFWFNPLVYLFRRAIQLNHEYLADEYVLTRTTSVYHYQNLILDQIQHGPQTLQLSSHFSQFSATKNRLLMMGKSTSSKKIFRNKLVMAPLLLFLLLFFGTAAQAQQSLTAPLSPQESLYSSSLKSPPTISYNFLNNWKWIVNFSASNNTITTIPKRDSLYTIPRSVELDTIYQLKPDIN